MLIAAVLGGVINLKEVLLEECGETNELLEECGESRELLEECGESRELVVE